MKAFKAYDIRGVFGADVTPELAYQVGRCLPALLDARTVLVGRDARTSSPALRDALVRGLSEAGAAVDDLGLATTPMVYFFTAEGGYGASVMITASHNPPEYNGFKVSKAGALPCGYDLGLKTVEAWIEAGTLPPKAACPGAVRAIDRLGDYVAWLRARLPDLSGLRFAVDCSDGAAGILAKDLFGSEAVYLNAEPDGAFPHHGPNPLEAANREALVRTVREQGLDLGLMFDGDADRVAFVDETGAFVPPDAMIPLYARLLGRSGETVVHDVRTSRGVIETLREDGFEPLMVKVGAAFAKTALRERGGVCGGEVAGHYYFRDFHWCDSGELSAVLALGIVAEAKRQGKTFSALLAPITGRYCASGEVNIRGVDDRPAAVARVEAAVTRLLGAPERRIDFDGVRLDWADAWFGVRPSNTEPILRLACEARTPAQLEAMLAAAKAAL